MRISGRARLAGVVGDPVAQSLSPRLHGHWLEAHGIDGAYVPLRVPREDFALVLASLRRAGFVGVNVTVPHKEAAFALAHTVDADAATAGAANLLLFEGDRIVARNTDASGLEASLREALDVAPWRGQTAVLLGAGGAARAAVLALDRLGFARIRIVARRRADDLAQALAGTITAVPEGFAWSRWPEAADGALLLINATSAGMTGKPPLDLWLSPLKPGAAVCDLVYNPLETPLLAAARARGHRAVGGLGMLMHQAVPSFAAFYGVTPVVSDALRRELEEALSA